MNSRSFWLALTLTVLAVSMQGQTQQKSTAKPATDRAQNPLQDFQSFSATLNGGIGRDHDRKIYRSGKVMRVDFDDHYRLVDLDKLTTRFVYPDRCRTIGFPDAGSYPISAYHGFKVERALTEDTETVDGHTCRIEDVTLTSTPKDGEPITIKMKLWEAEDLKGFPVKAEIDAGHDRTFTVNYANVSLTPPDPALFKNPASCPTGATAGGWKGAAPGKPGAPKKATPKPPSKSQN
jgi:outer membrane lipoprotein-sorting protein